jgi:anti-anti-sigma factor
LREAKATVAFTVVVEHLDGTVLVCPVGELDLAAAPVLEQVLDTLVGSPPAVELDLSGIVFADCAGLRPIRAAVGRAPHSSTRLRVSGARPNVRRVLALTGLQVAEAPADLP